MSLKALNCYQPECDYEGCDFVIIGDNEIHFSSPEEAAKAWREYEGWTDLKVWVCEDHANDPHPYIGEPNSACDRCLVWHDVHPEVES